MIFLSNLFFLSKIFFDRDPRNCLNCESFLKTAYYRCHRHYCSYNIILEKLKTHPLKLRRDKLEAMFLYKVLNHHIDCPDLLEQIYFRVPTFRSRSKALFQLPCVRTNAGKRAPLYRMCSTYNASFVSLDPFNTSICCYRRGVEHALSCLP